MATICIGVSNTGSGTGSDWNNQKALSSFTTTTWVRTNTYYIADGTYATLQVNTVVNGSQTITILKATIADHGPATGWNDTFGDGQATFTGVFISKDWVIFDGQTGGGPTAWTSGFGFKIDTSAQTPDVNTYPALFYGEATQALTSNCTARHFEVVGNNTANSSSAGQTNDGVSSYGSTNLTIEYAYIHDMGRCPFIVVNNCTNYVVQYCYTGKYQYSGPSHSEIASTNGNGMVWRWNIFANATGTGGLMFNATAGQIYGNVFFHSVSDTSWDYAANGLIGSKDSGEPVSNIHIYNNTFYRVYSDGTGGGAQIYGFYMTTNSDAKNNLYYGLTAPGNWTQITHDYNLYQALSGDTPPIETNRQVVASGNPFVNAEGLNFALTANTNPGTDTSATIAANSVDMLGNTRTTWTRGAIEYTSGGGGTTTIKRVGRYLRLFGPALLVMIISYFRHMMDGSPEHVTLDQVRAI